MKRRADWRDRLIGYISGQVREPFKYGRNDCALFTAGAIEAMTGEDLARGFRGYRSLKSGAQKLKEKGFSDHVELAAALLQEIPVAFAHAGDVAVVRDQGELALGIVQGPGIYVLRRDGVGIVELIEAERAFRV